MADVVILGGGLTGLAAASQLGPHAIVLERETRAGGLVRSVHLGDFWFDQVLHLLYFWDDDTARLVKGLLGETLSACVPEAFVETNEGVTRFPFQMHLGALPRALVIRCLRDLAAHTFAPRPAPPTNFLDWLIDTFGDAMCETFFFPYNRKMWKRPLDSLAPKGFQWNIANPEFEKVLAGAFEGPSDYSAYNAAGLYPRPDRNSGLRGMEVLVRALATRVQNLQCDVTVKAIDPERRIVEAEADGKHVSFAWDHSCLSTLPLPTLINLCTNAPDTLRAACRSLLQNRVVMVYLALHGPRPDPEFGHWRYYTDETVCFTRLVSMTAFDPACAPADGWALMAEIPEPAEAPLLDPDEWIGTVLADARKVGAVGESHRVIHATLRVFDPAYVVFTPDNQAVIDQAREWARDQGITPLGRYGRWEYSSMAQNMRDGFGWGHTVADAVGYTPPADLTWSIPDRNAETR